LRAAHCPEKTIERHCDFFWWTNIIVKLNWHQK